MDPYGTTWVTVNGMEGEDPTESSAALNYANALLKFPQSVEPGEKRGMTLDVCVYFCQNE